MSNALPEVVIISGARTPMAEWIGGKRGDGLNGGALAPLSAIDLGAAATRGALERADIQDIDKIKHSDIRKKIGIVQQDIFLFEESIRYNLLLVAKKY